MQVVSGTIYAPTVHFEAPPSSRMEQENTRKRIEFSIEKTKLYDRLRGKLNERQQKVIERIFREGVDGFKGGLSAEDYISITGAPRTTATRDLNDLVAKGALTKTGQLKYTRYHLNIAG